MPVNDRFPPFPYPLSVTPELYALVSRTKQRWKGGWEGASFITLFCLDEMIVWCES